MAKRTSSMLGRLLNGSLVGSWPRLAELAESRIAESRLAERGGGITMVYPPTAALSCSDMSTGDAAVAVAEVLGAGAGAAGAAAGG